MRKYKVVYTIDEVNALAKDGYVLHSVTQMMSYVMEWVEPTFRVAKPGSFEYHNPTQFGDHN